jgi:hypothetical protein
MSAEMLDTLFPTRPYEFFTEAERKELVTSLAPQRLQKRHGFKQVLNTGAQKTTGNIAFPTVPAFWQKNLGSSQPAAPVSEPGKRTAEFKRMTSPIESLKSIQITQPDTIKPLNESFWTDDSMNNDDNDAIVTQQQKPLKTKLKPVSDTSLFDEQEFSLNVHGLGSHQQTTALMPKTESKPLVTPEAVNNLMQQTRLEDIVQDQAERLLERNRFLSNSINNLAESYFQQQRSI